MDVTEYTAKLIVFSSWVENLTQKDTKPTKTKFDLFKPLRQWFDNIAIEDPRFAHMLCQAIPSRCPFERQIKFLGRTLITIPPLCKLNPFYGELVALRFRALCYLADTCGEDISAYC